MALSFMVEQRVESMSVQLNQFSFVESVLLVLVQYIEHTSLHSVQNSLNEKQIVHSGRLV